MSQFVETQIADGVQTIRMNRPEKKNALTADMYGALAAALKQADSDDSVRVSLLLGMPGAFCAGNDIADFMAAAMSGNRDSNAVIDFLERIIMAGKPVAAGVDGVAIGIGTTMLLHCDYVVASQDSLFRTPFVDLGLITEAGSSLIAPRLIGHHRAFALLAMGEALDAEGAREAGFVNRVVPAGELEAAASGAAGALASKPAEALKIARRLIRGDRTEILARMKEEAKLFAERIQSAEARQAFGEFLNRSQKKAS
jgi:enoyl-CoA hydratase/carnithine racemase